MDVHPATRDEVIEATVLTEPTLYIFSGLPGSGKSTIAKELAVRTDAAYLRIDTIEQALRDLCNVRVEGEGYRLAYRVAADNLEAGNSVIADSCNPIALTRGEWESVAQDRGIGFVNIEVICSDPVEHRRRVEERVVDVDGLELPTWQQVQDREYHSWTSARIVIDTAGRTMRECADELMARLEKGAFL